MQHDEYAGLRMPLLQLIGDNFITREACQDLRLLPLVPSAHLLKEVCHTEVKASFSLSSGYEPWPRDFSLGEKQALKQSSQDLPKVTDFI